MFGIQKLISEECNLIYVRSKNIKIQKYPTQKAFERHTLKIQINKNILFYNFFHFQMNK